jgi:hypothetical protein
MIDSVLLIERTSENLHAQSRMLLAKTKQPRKLFLCFTWELVGAVGDKC